MLPLPLVGISAIGAYSGRGRIKVNRLGGDVGQTKEEVRCETIRCRDQCFLKAVTIYNIWWRRASSILGDEDDLKVDGDDEFDPLLEDEDDEEGAVSTTSGGQELLYIGSLKVNSTFQDEYGQQ